jgi:uncharacterized protein YggE
MQMHRIVAAAITLAGLCVPPAALAAGTPQDAPVPTMTVTGQGQVSRAPDLATIGATIVTNDETAARALSENNTRYAALLTKLGALGIGERDIKSTSITSYFSPRPSGQPANAPGQLYGFVVTRTAQINVGALAQTGAIVDAATAAGATQINGVTYGFHDQRAVERAALAVAVADANAQALAIAAAAHVQIVRILRMGDEAPVRSADKFAPLAMSRAAEAPAPTTISPSDLDVYASISVTYVIR